MVPSIAISLGLLTGAFLLFLAALWQTVRGAGKISVLRGDLILLTTQVEALDTRITREVKTRAGLTRAEKAEEDRSVEQQAQDLLREVGPPLPFPERPKRPIRRN